MNQQAQDRNGAGAHRGARTFAGALVILLASAMMASAGASPNDPPRRDDARSQPQAQPRGNESRWSSSDQRAFEARADEQRRIMQENANNAEMSRRTSRMTADEKADLRRQINNASRDVYSVPAQAPRR